MESRIEKYDPDAFDWEEEYDPPDEHDPEGDIPHPMRP